MSGEKEEVAALMDIGPPDSFPEECWAEGLVMSKVSKKAELMIEATASP